MAGRNAEILGLHTYAPIGMSYMQYGSTLQSIVVMASEIWLKHLDGEEVEWWFTEHN